ncbi:MAG: tyrosine-type recombinase/integrase [Nitrosarchaeum sp.]
MKKNNEPKEINETSFSKVRNIENYLDKIRLKSKGTVKNTDAYLKKLDSYLKDTYNKSNVTIFDEILAMPSHKQERTLYDILQDFVNYLDSNNIGSGYVRNVLYSVKGYLRFYGFKITSEDLKDNVTLPRVVEEEREPLTREQLQLIVNNQTGLRRVLYLFMSSSGMRPSEALQIRKRDLELDKYDRIMIKIPAKITKTKKSRITFISKETEKELLPFLRKINDDSYIFNQSNRTMEQARLNELQIFGRLRVKIGLTQKYESGIHNVSLGDSLRSWFVTKCNRIDYGVGHALAGHDQYMKRYDRLTVEDKIELYIKAEKLLQVFEYVDEDNEKKIASLESRLKELEGKEKEMNDIAPMASIMLCAMKNDPEFTKMVNDIAVKNGVAKKA